ncbi:MAG: hypothetical protein L0Z73_12980 [Gammaproteobacteria bacterium]|nr:hypothetical protein [Gammaproteobacteria bacterium]
MTIRGTLNSIGRKGRLGFRAACSAPFLKYNSARDRWNHDVTAGQYQLNGVDGYVELFLVSVKCKDNTRARC